MIKLVRIKLSALQTLPSSVQSMEGNLTIVHSIHPDHRHHLEEDFGLGLDEFAAAAVPTGSFEIEAVHVNPFCGGLGDVILHPLGHLVEQNHAVQRPALVGPSDLLQVQSQIQ